jgi:hypothetical protein
VRLAYERETLMLEQILSAFNQNLFTKFTKKWGTQK